MSKLIIKKCEDCDCTGHKACFPLCFPICFTGSHKFLIKAVNKAKQIITSSNTNKQLGKSKNE